MLLIKILEKMKKLNYLLMALLAVLVVMPISTNAQSNKKKKKAKKEFVWDWNHEKSGNEDVDAYLMACDTLWNDITQYQENITAYEFKEDTFKLGDKYYVQAWMQTKDNALLTKAAANWQLVESVTSGISIVANSVQIAAQTASATMALPSLGLKAFSYGKYVKAGPIIIGKAGKEIKEIVVLRKEQMNKWKAMRKDAIDPATLFPDMDPALLEKLSKSYFIKELKPEEAGYDEIKTVMEQKSPEELAQDQKDWLAALEAKTELPEDAQKTLKDDDDAFMKEAGMELPEEA